LDDLREALTAAMRDLSLLTEHELRLHVDAALAAIAPVLTEAWTLDDLREALKKCLPEMVFVAWSDEILAVIAPALAELEGRCARFGSLTLRAQDRADHYETALAEARAAQADQAELMAELVRQHSGELEKARAAERERCEDLLEKKARKMFQEIDATNWHQARITRHEGAIKALKDAAAAIRALSDPGE